MNSFNGSRHNKSHYAVVRKQPSGAKRWREMVERDEEEHIKELEREFLDEDVEDDAYRLAYKIIVSN